MIILSGLAIMLKGAVTYFPVKYFRKQISTPVWILILSSLVLMIINFDLDVTKEMYNEDGTLENLTVILLLTGMSMLVFLCIIADKTFRRPGQEKTIE
jgi:zinc transporter ZupT